MTERRNCNESTYCTKDKDLVSMIDQIFYAQFEGLFSNQKEGRKD